MSEHESTGPEDTGSGSAAPGPEDTGAAAANRAAAGDDARSDAQDAVRQQGWAANGPAEIEVGIDVGRVRIELVDEADEVLVEVRHEPDPANPFAQGVSGLLNWLGSSAGPDLGKVIGQAAAFRQGAFGKGGAFGEGGPFGEGGAFREGGAFGPGAGPADQGAAAVRAAEITWSEPARRLVVRSTGDLPLRVVPLAVVVRAPARSRLAVRTGAGDVTVTGTAGWAAVRTGSGEARLGAIEGQVEVTTGSGAIELGAVDGKAKIRTGSGRVSAAALAASTSIKAGNGAVRLGEVAADLSLRTGSGDVEVSDAVSGTYDLTTGSGGIRIGVHSGVAAELDLSSGSGRARSDLHVGAVAPATEPALRIRGRTGTGDVLVTRAADAASA
jgi:hypothetical protein